MKILWLVILSLFVVTAYVHYSPAFGDNCNATVPESYEMEDYYMKREPKTYEMGDDYIKNIFQNSIVEDIDTDLAAEYRSSGRYTEALALNEKIYELRKKELGEENSITLQALNNLAVSYSDLGRYNEALELNKKAYALLKEKLGEEHPDTLTSLANLAVTYDAVADLAVTHDAALENYGKAFKYNKEVYNLRKKVLGEQDSDTLQSLNNLAVSYFRQEEYTEALKMSEEAYELRKQVLGAVHPDTLSSLNNLALNYRELGNYEKALSLSKENYRLRTELLGEQHPDTLVSLSNVAHNYADLKNYKEAITHFEQALAGFETLLADPQLNTDVRLTMAKGWRSTYFRLAESYFQQQQINDAFITVERAKSRSLLTEMARKFAIHYAGLNDKEIEQLEHLHASINKSEEIIAQTDDVEKRQNLRAEQTRLTQELATLHQQLTEKYPKYHQLTTVQTAKIEPQLLPNDSLLINYLINSDNHLLAFVLSNTGESQSYDLGILPRLEHTIEAYRKILAVGNIPALRSSENGGLSTFELQDGSFVTIITKPEDARGDRLGKGDETKIAQYLSDKLLTPLYDSIADKKRWIIAPDGVLALLAFETLPFDKQPVIENYTVSYIQSLSVLKLLKQRQEAYHNQTNNLLAVGAARYEDPNKPSSKETTVDSTELALSIRRGTADQTVLNQAIRAQRDQWKNLPGSDRALTHLTTLFSKDNSLVLREQDASEANLQALNQDKALTKYRYLLFSTHGYFSPLHPVLSGIALDQLHTPDPTDGYISAAEWIGYDLRSDLMVLSACETGVGQTSGDGVLGLPYSLYVAGNTNTLLTLWTINDDSTAEFISRFFEYLKQGKDQVSALTTVKREFLHNKKYKNPLYWAAFVLYGI